MRASIPLSQSTKLINHGPTTLLTTAFQGRANVMAAAWVMALEADPPRLCAVISRDTLTRENLEKTGQLVVSLPTVALIEPTFRAGKLDGRAVDKLVVLGLKTAPASLVAPPLVEGCAAWLECTLRDERAAREAYDLVLLDVVAAWADDEVFQAGEWRFERNPSKRTLHHMTRGVFLASGERLEVRSA